VTASSITQNSFRLSWEPGSALTTRFVVAMRRQSNSRDVGSEWTVVQDSNGRPPASGARPLPNGPDTRSE